MLTDLPKNFVQNILGLHKTKGADWLKDLPEIIWEIEKNWSLKVGKPFENLSYHFVAPCFCNDGGKEAVLKVAIPEENSPIFNEKRILEIFKGEGAVKVLKFDKNFFALLLEKLTPGENLIEICQTNDAQANTIAINLMRRLLTKTTEEDDFPTLENWISGLNKSETSNFAPQLVRKARKYFDELIAASKKSFLIHGDLHHQNILSAAREPFLAIDPKGIVGDIGFEISTFLNNPRGWVLSHPNREKILAGRIKQFSEAFEIEPQNLRKWAFAEAMLSAWWTFEESRTDWKKGIYCAEIWEV